MKRQLAILLSAAMVLGSSVTAMAADVTFRDLNDVPWEGAKKLHPSGSTAGFDGGRDQ